MTVAVVLLEKETTSKSKLESVSERQCGVHGSGFFVTGSKSLSSLTTKDCHIISHRLHLFQQAA